MLNPEMPWNSLARHPHVWGKIHSDSMIKKVRRAQQASLFYGNDIQEPIGLALPNVCFISRGSNALTGKKCPPPGPISKATDFMESLIHKDSPKCYRLPGGLATLMAPTARLCLTSYDSDPAQALGAELATVLSPWPVLPLITLAECLLALSCCPWPGHWACYGKDSGLADYRLPSMGRHAMGADHCCWQDGGVAEADDLSQDSPVRPAKAKLPLRLSQSWSTTRRFRAAPSPAGDTTGSELTVGAGCSKCHLLPQSTAAVYLPGSSAALCSVAYAFSVMPRT